MISRVILAVIGSMLAVIFWLLWQNYQNVRDLQIPQAEEPSQIEAVIEFCRDPKHEGSPLCSTGATPDPDEIQRRIEDIVTTPFGGGSHGDTEIVVGGDSDDSDDGGDTIIVRPTTVAPRPTATNSPRPSPTSPPIVKLPDLPKVRLPSSVPKVELPLPLPTN